MPLGNGDAGINAWVGESGDLVFYVSKTDAWSELGRLLKLGRVRVRFQPNPFGPGKPFRQTLNLAKGEITITGGQPVTTVKLWVDANNPVIRVESEHPEDADIQVYYERWRDQQRLLEGQETNSAYGMQGSPEPLIAYGDSLQLDAQDRVVWYHRNPKSIYAQTMKLQGLEDMAKAYGDPLLHRTFGAAIEGPGLVRMNNTALRSMVPQRRHAVNVFVHTAIHDDSQLWISELNALIARVNLTKAEDRRAVHNRWWDTFWNRSYIRVTGGPDQEAVTRGYLLQRFIDACGGRGAYPIKFNGSIFTWDAKVEEAQVDADYRRWGGAYRFQNTRLIYWTMLANGDPDLMTPLFDMYVQQRFIAETRTKRYFNHEGAFFPEAMYFWGAYGNDDYGWKREGKPLSWVENTYIRHHFTSSLELLAMMLDYADYFDDKRFVRDSLGPFAEAVITFYDKHYERDEQGKLRMSPAQALETWQEAANPTPDIAGLRYVINRMVAQKVPVSKQTQNTMRRLLTQLPEIPLKKEKSASVILPAERTFGEAKNTENPELYAVFPFRLYGVNKPDLEIGRATFEARRNKRNGGWSQDSIHAAYLGLARPAWQMVSESFTTPAAARFPAFWGSNVDWAPDQDHGHVAMLALQSMLMQTEGDKIVLFPAWPKDLDVEFKLRAAQNTTVEGVWKRGKLEKLVVTPSRRASDVVQMQPE